MFFGRECWRNPEILLEMLGQSDVEAKASPKWLQPLIKAYIYLFGLPEVGTQLRLFYFRRFAKQLKFDSALDAGCGIGLNCFYLAKANPSAKIDACDYNPNLINAGQQMLRELKLSNLSMFQADLTELHEFDERDLIVCMDVIDQIEDDEQLIRSFHKALKDNGILCLSIPHRRHTKRYFTSLEWVSDKRHVREGYTEFELAELLENNGFRIRQLRNTFGIFGECCHELYILAIRRLPLAFAAMIFPLLSIIASIDLLTRNRKGYGLMVIAQKD